MLDSLRLGKKYAMTETNSKENKIKIKADTKGVSETLCMRLSPCGFDGSFVEPFWV